MSPAKKRQYHDPSLEELLRDMPDNSCAVRDYGAMRNEIERSEVRIRDLEALMVSISGDLAYARDEIMDMLE